MYNMATQECRFIILHVKYWVIVGVYVYNKIITVCIYIYNRYTGHNGEMSKTKKIEVTLKTSVCCYSSIRLTKANICTAALWLS